MSDKTKMSLDQFYPEKQLKTTDISEEKKCIKIKLRSIIFFRKEEGIMKKSKKRIFICWLIAICMMIASCSSKKASTETESNLNTSEKYIIDSDSSNQMFSANSENQGNQKTSFDVHNMKLFEEDSYLVQSMNSCGNNVVMAIATQLDEKVQDTILIVDANGEILDSVLLNDMIPEEMILSVSTTSEGKIYILSRPDSSTEESGVYFSLYETNVDDLYNVTICREKIRFPDGVYALEVICVGNELYIRASSSGSGGGIEFVLFYSDLDENKPFEKVNLADGMMVRYLVAINNKIAIIDEQYEGEDNFISVTFLEQEKCKSPIQIKTDEFPTNVIGVGTDLFFSNSIGIFFVDFTKEDFFEEQILSYEEIGLIRNTSETNIMIFPFSKSNILYTSVLNSVDSNGALLIGNQFVLIQKSDGKIESKKITVAGKLIQLCPEFLSLIRNYNLNNKDIQIVILEDPDNQDGVPFEEKLSLSILAGEGPDILFSQSESLERYFDSGYLMNLYDFIDQDAELNPKDYISNIWKLGEKNGELYQIFPFFTITGFMGRESQIGSKNSLTFAEFERLEQSAKNNQRLIAYQTQTALFSFTALSQIDEFINYDERTVNFDSQNFYDLLSFAKRNGEEFQFASEVEAITEEELIKNDELILMNVRKLGHPLTFQDYSNVFSEPAQLIGFPASNVGSPVCVPDIILSITSDSNEKDAAWDFIKYLLSEEMQHGFAQGAHIPMLTSAFEAQIQFSNTQSDELQRPLSAKNEENYRKAVNSIDRVSIVDVKIADIMAEEVAPYFANQKTEKEVIQIIHDRVMTVLNERR